MSNEHERGIEAAQTSLGHEAVYVGASTVGRAIDAYLAATPDFGTWATKWHSTVETMCVMLGINGNGSPEEILAELQAYLSALAPQAGDNAEIKPSIDTMREAARDLVIKMGWKPGDQLSAHSVLGLMAEFGMRVYRGEVGCGYPDCGCCADAVCGDAIKQHPHFASHPCTSTPVVSQNAPDLEGKPCMIADPSSRDCPNMKEVGGGMDGERYRCAVCGKGYYLDYEEMK